MKKIYLLLLLPMFSIAQSLEGQKFIDSLSSNLQKMKEDTLKVNLLNKISSRYRYVNPAKGVEYGNKAKVISKKINWIEGISNSNYEIAFNLFYNANYYESIKYSNLTLTETNDVKKKIKSLNLKGLCYTSLKNYPKSLSEYYKALKLAEKTNNLNLSSYNNLGNLFYNLKNYSKSIELYKKELAISEKYKDLDSQYSCLINISSAYSKLNEYSKSLDYNNLALKLSLKEGYSLKTTDTYYNLGLIYNNLKDYNKAIECFNKSLKIDEILNDFYNSSSCYDGIGAAYIKLKKYDLAIDNLNKARKINVSDKNIYFEASNLNKLGEIHLILANQSIENRNQLVKKSILNLKKAIKIESEIGNIENLSSNHRLLSDAYKLQGNYKAALEAHEQYVIYKDSIFNADNKETIKNLEDKREIELRDNKLKINQLELNSKEKQKWYLFGGLGLLTVIGGLLFYQSRKRKQINLKLETLNQNLDAKNLELDQANKAKTRFFGILNHDLRGPVANLVFFLQLQQESPEMLDAESIKRMQDKTMTGAENLLSTMEDILQWSKSQMENFKPQPKQIAVNKLFDDTKKVFSGYLKISFDYQNPENIEIFTDENYLKTIIRNLTSNAINVFTNTENPKIIWKAWQENNVSYFSIQDNGPGANEDQFNALFEDTEIKSAKSGLGLYLIRDMAKAINCEISVDSKVNEGTTFILLLKH